VGSHHNIPREAVATIRHSVKIMAEKENNQRHESTIDKYFSRTADGYNACVEEGKEDRNYLQIAAETTGDTDEEGNQGFDFHIAYSGKVSILASGIAQTMQKDLFLRHLIIEAARKYFAAEDKK
jgi:hypothetical protein